MIGRLLRCDRIPTVCEESLPLFDLRVFKLMGVMMSVSPLGTDPFSALTIKEELLKDHDYTDNNKNKSNIKDYLLASTILDYYGLSQFMVFPASENKGFFELLLKLSNSAFGITIPENEVLLHSIQSHKKHLEFNSKSGFQKNKIPDFFRHEKLYPLGELYDIENISEDNILR